MLAHAVFQRSESGRREITHKSHGLTQSERSVLIVMDGVTSVSEIQKKLKGLSLERFERALNNLKSKELIFEVLFAAADMKPEIIDPVDADRFLQQDLLDPVTIVAFDADDDYDLDSPEELPSINRRNTVINNPKTKPSSDARAVSSHTTTSEVSGSPEVPKPENVDFYIPLDKMSPAADVFLVNTNPRSGEITSSGTRKLASNGLRVFLGPVLVVTGIALLVVPLFLKMLR